ncbi:Uncharacterised protein [Klebsiella pneumoniae]|nr:Uncharacterised protein [Klebsiella pneumoniae]SYV44149.1 Uncharacterised protein [Klebsiella pneumoniae]
MEIGFIDQLAVIIHCYFKRMIHGLKRFLTIDNRRISGLAAFGAKNNSYALIAA